MSKIEIRKKIDELLIVDDVNLIRFNDILQVGFAKAAKIIDYVEEKGFLIEMGQHQKKFNFDYYDEIKDVIFERCLMCA